MEIVQFKENHIAEVVSLWDNAVNAQRGGVEKYVLSEQRLLDIMRDERFLPAGAVVALDSDKIVGFARGYIEPSPLYKKEELRANPGQLVAVVVDPDYWRQGIAKALIAAVEKALKDEGQSTVDFCSYDPALDSGVYYFLLSCGYLPCAHIISFCNDLSKFQLSKNIKERKQKLEDNGIVFRWYQQADREDLLQFWEKCFPYWHDPAGMDQYPNTKFILALSNDDIVGFIGSFYAAGDHGSFGSPGVHPDFRRRGIGAILLHLGLDYLKHEGAIYIPYKTHADNPAQYMYLKSGAEFTGVHCGWFRKKL